MLDAWLKESRAHLRSVDEDYLEHMHFASRVGRILIVAGICCLIHSLIPALFPTSASRRIRLLGEALRDRSVVASPKASARSQSTLAMLLLMATTISLVLLGSGADLRIASALSAVSFTYPAAFLLAARKYPGSPEPAN